MYYGGKCHDLCRKVHVVCVTSFGRLRLPYHNITSCSKIVDLSCECMHPRRFGSCTGQPCSANWWNCNCDFCCRVSYYRSCVQCLTFGKLNINISSRCFGASCNCKWLRESVWFWVVRNEYLKLFIISISAHLPGYYREFAGFHKKSN